MMKAQRVQSLWLDLGETLAHIRVPSLVLELAVPAEDRLDRQAELICQRMTAAPSAIWQRIPMNDVELLQRRPELLADVVKHFVGEH